MSKYLLSTMYVLNTAVGTIANGNKEPVLVGYTLQLAEDKK